jgi:hypothetical protein
VSVFAINKICYRALHDVAFREAAKRDPVAAIRDLPLTQEEREALLAGDVARLYEWGVNAFLMSHLTRFELFGLTAMIYSERIRAARDPR